MNQDIRLEEGFRIVITLSNPIEEDILEKFRAGLVQYLKEKLRNGSITLGLEYSTSSTIKKIYTDKEKLDYLIQKKPLLKTLRDKLGLDPDF